LNPKPQQVIESTVSKDLDCSLESNKTSANYYDLTVGIQGQVKWAKLA